MLILIPRTWPLCTKSTRTSWWSSTADLAPDEQLTSADRSNHVAEIKHRKDKPRCAHLNRPRKGVEVTLYLAHNGTSDAVTMKMQTESPAHVPTKITGDPGMITLWKETTVKPSHAVRASMNCWPS